MSTRLPPLVEPEALADALDSGIRLVHVAEAAAFRQAHLAGAIPVEPAALVCGEQPAPGKLPSLSRLEALFGAMGYRPEQHLVVYDDEGGGWAGRFIWTLDVIGHGGWSYLNGGLHAWHAAGLPLAAGAAQPIQATEVALTLHPGPVAELHDVWAALNDPGTIIWDVRSAEEYRGERSAARRAGHIPGARHLDWMRLKDPARNMRLTDELPALLKQHGIEPDKQVITHCQTHHRSGLSYLVGRLSGFRSIRAFHGSWSEWGNRDDTPVATGDAPGHWDRTDGA